MYEMTSGSATAWATSSAKRNGSSGSSAISIAKAIPRVEAADASMIAVDSDGVRPASRSARSRVAIASVDRTASSTRTASAIANPVITIRLIESPRRSSTSTPAISETGIASAAITAARHWKSSAPRAARSRMAPSTAARVRLSTDSSMYVAGRAIEVSMSMPARPGRSLSSASSTPRVTSSVLAFGNFSITIRLSSPPVSTASPISGWWSSTTSATSLRRSGAAPSTVTFERSSALTIGKMWRTSSRCCGVSIQPPEPGVDAWRKVSGDTHMALPVVFTI